MFAIPRHTYRSYSNDYTAFGSIVTERSQSFGNSYKYGFNNQEKDAELGDYYSFEYRIHDARLGRFLSVDPLAASYPWQSPYIFAANNPILLIDIDGMGPGDPVKSGEGPLAYAKRNGIKGLNDMAVLEQLANSNVDIFPNYPILGSEQDKQNYWYGSGKEDWKYTFNKGINLTIYHDADDYMPFISQTAMFTSPSKIPASLDKKIEARSWATRTWGSAKSNLYNEYKSGTGPQNSLLTDDHPDTKIIRDWGFNTSAFGSLVKADPDKSELERAKYMAVEKYLLTGASYYIEFKFKWGLSDHLTIPSAPEGNGNHPAHFIGSCAINVFFEGNRMVFVVDDEKSRYSEGAHLLNAVHRNTLALDADGHVHSFGVNGNTYQFYCWTVYFDRAELTKWYINEKKRRDTHGHVKKEPQKGQHIPWGLSW